MIDLESPYGQMLPDSKYYIKRPPHEEASCREIEKRGALLRIKAPRQMGKSSLMGYILHHAKQQGYRTAAVSFQGLDRSVLENLDQLLLSFCENVALQLNLDNKPQLLWKGFEGSKPKCTSFFQKFVLNLNKPLVLGLDEVDSTFQYLPIAREFLGLLRSWHEQGKNDDIWGKLRLIITHSQEVYMFLDAKESPFNVGQPIDLPEFTLFQANDLVARHGLIWPEPHLRQLMALVGGHPFLMRVALYEMVNGQRMLDEFLRLALTRQGPYATHLNHHESLLKEKPELLAAFKQVIQADQAIRLPSDETFKLHGMGLVKYVGNDVVPFCELYRQYFLDILT